MKLLAHKIEFAKDKIVKTKELIELKFTHIRRLNDDFSNIDMGNENAQNQSRHIQAMQFCAEKEMTVLETELEQWEELFDRLIREI